MKGVIKSIIEKREPAVLRLPIPSYTAVQRPERLPGVTVEVEWICFNIAAPEP